MAPASRVAVAVIVASLCACSGSDEPDLARSLVPTTTRAPEAAGVPESGSAASDDASEAVSTDSSGSVSDGSAGAGDADPDEATREPTDPPPDDPPPDGETDSRDDAPGEDGADEASDDGGSGSEATTEDSDASSDDGETDRVVIGTVVSGADLIGDPTDYSSETCGAAADSCIAATCFSADEDACGGGYPERGIVSMGEYEEGIVVPKGARLDVYFDQSRSRDDMEHRCENAGGWLTQHQHDGSPWSGWWYCQIYVVEGAGS